MPNFDTAMAKVKKYELILEDEMTLEVIGISSAFADYRLAWELNQCFNINLVKNNDVFVFADEMDIPVFRTKLTAIAKNIYDVIALSPKLFIFNNNLIFSL